VVTAATAVPRPSPNQRPGRRRGRVRALQQVLEHEAEGEAGDDQAGEDQHDTDGRLHGPSFLVPSYDVVGQGGLRAHGVAAAAFAAYSARSARSSSAESSSVPLVPVAHPTLTVTGEGQCIERWATRTRSCSARSTASAASQPGSTERELLATSRATRSSARSPWRSSAADVRQHLVADRVAVHVVDELEVVEVSTSRLTTSCPLARRLRREAPAG
jgi:hypothetical protein